MLHERKTPAEQADAARSCRRDRSGWNTGKARGRPEPPPLPRVVRREICHFRLDGNENSCVCGFMCLTFLAPGCWKSGFQMFRPSPMLDS